MFKISKKLKKIFATVILFITLFGYFQTVVKAANDVITGSGSEKFMARQYATRVKTTDEGSNTENGIIARRLIMRDSGWNFSNGDGIIVFCAQNHVPFATGKDYQGTYAPPSTEQLKKAAKIAYFRMVSKTRQLWLKWSS